MVSYLLGLLSEITDYTIAMLAVADVLMLDPERVHQPFIDKHTTQCRTVQDMPVDFFGCGDAQDTQEGIVNRARKPLV